jgi:hypothetical protein
MKTATILTLFAFLTFAIQATAEDLYHIRQLSEPELLETYTQILRDGCSHADQSWKTSSNNPDEGYWGDGASAGNEGIRTIASMELACATLIKYDDGLAADVRAELLRKSIASLRFIAATHITGTEKCPDGKHWGATKKFGAESWQSGMWTGTFAFGAWLIWDKLDTNLQESLHRVIAHEDDILSQRPPPNGLWLDTKAEENGWEVPPLVLGELMFPSDPRSKDWREGAVKYMMNTLCTAADTNDATIVDGKPVKDRVKGANIQSDFTLENHNIFHPSYVGCSSYFLTQAAMYYTFGRQPVPESASHHLQDVWKMFQTIILPWGEAAYPQGMDWELHGLSFFNLFASLAARDHDALAAGLENRNIQYWRAWQNMWHGDLAEPGSRFGIARHAINCEQTAYGFLAHKIFGAPPEGTADDITGVWEHPYIDFIVHRTDKKFASFSWKNRIMGLIMPIGTGHEGNPDFTVPIPNGWVGSFDLIPAAKPGALVLEHAFKKTPDGFETSGTLLIGGGKMKQYIAAASIGDQTMVYEDRVVALSQVTIAREHGLPLGIENDEITGDSRVVASGPAEITFDTKNPRPLISLPASWANVDGRLGIVMVEGSGLAYAQAKNYTPGIFVRADCLYGSYQERPQHFAAGREVVHRLAVVFAEVSAKQTAELAKSCRIEKTSGGPVLHFKQPDGKETALPLFGN